MTPIQADGGGPTGTLDTRPAGDATRPTDLVAATPDGSPPGTDSSPRPGEVGPGAKLDGGPDSAPIRDTAPTVDTAPPRAWKGGPVVVAVGYGGRHALSRDGVTWFNDVRDPGQKGNVPNGKTFLDVAYARDLVVAVGGGCATGGCLPRIATFDGETWTDVAVPRGTSYLTGVTYGAGTWVAVGDEGMVLTSPDGRTWTLSPTRNRNKVDLNAVAFGKVGGKDQFIVVGDKGFRGRSQDGFTWTDQVEAVDGTDLPPDFMAVVIAKDVAIAAGDDGRRLRTRDGVTWGDPARGGNGITSVVLADKFFAYDGTDRVFISDDGASWTTQVLVDPPAGRVAAGQIGNARLFVGNVLVGGIKSSTNGIAWITRLPGLADDPAFTAFTFAGQ